MKKVLLISAAMVCAGVMVSGCSSAMMGNYGVRIAKAADVVHCKFLGDVHSSAHFGNSYHRALDDAMQEAKKMGATDVVLDTGKTSSIGPYSKSEVTGKAYQCPKTSEEASG